MNDLAANNDQRTRYFVLTHGGSRSSLLCAILADAGADFGMPAPAETLPGQAAMEHPEITVAAHHYRRANDALAGDFVVSPRLEAKWRRWRARRRLRRAMMLASYVKANDLDLVVQPAFKLGYSPRVILSYRRFGPAMVLGRTHAGPDALARDYLRLYQQGLMLLDAFGGCVVGYESLVKDPDAIVRALAAVTGLDAARLAQAHARRVRTTEVADTTPAIYRHPQALFERLQARHGQAVPPSAAVLRRLERGSASSGANR